MANLAFFDRDHRYTLDGNEIPSVSEITRFMSRDLYAEVQQNFLDKAAERGNIVHRATEILDKYRSAEIDEENAGYLKAYMSFLKDYSPEWEKIEWAVNNGTLYAGTLDRYGVIQSKHTIVDLKTTGNISPRHRSLYTAGQNLYRMAIEKEYQVDAIWILQLKIDGTYKIFEIEIQDELANACLALHQAMRKKKRAKKEERND